MSRTVSGGTLVTVRVRYGDRVESCALRGDFLFEPAALSDAERAVVGLPSDAPAARAAVDDD